MQMTRKGKRETANMCATKVKQEVVMELSVDDIEAAVFSL